MLFCTNQNTAGNQIVDEIRNMAKNGLVVITKDDCCSIKAKIPKYQKYHFSIQMNGILLQGREICLGNYYKNIKTDENGVIYANEYFYHHLTLDGKQSIYLGGNNNMSVELNEQNDLSFELSD